MANTPKVRRPSKQAEQDDAFIARMLELSTWARRNVRALVVGGVLVALGVAAALYYTNFQSQLRQQAASRLTEIQQTANSGNPALAIRDLDGFVDRFDGTPSASEGRVLLARLHLEQGQASGAIPVIRPLAGDLDAPLGVPAASLLAAAYEAVDQADQAEATYLRIAEGAEFGFQRREALNNAARLRMQQGDPAGAAELYERLLAIMPDDDTQPQVQQQRGLYEMRLAEARAAAASAAAASSPSG